VLATATLGVWFGSPWSAVLEAQTPTFSQCMAAVGDAQVAPLIDDRGGFQSPDDLLAGSWQCAGRYAEAELVPIGLAMLGGLVIIMVVWAGVGFMFSGQFDLGSLLGTLFLAGFGFFVINNYFTPTVPFLPPQGFVGLVSEQAVAWGDLIMGSASEDMQRAFVRAQVRAGVMYLDGVQRVAADPDGLYADTVGSEDPVEAAGGLGSLLTFEARMFMMRGFHWGIIALLWFIGWMIYAQYVWGFFTLTVLTALGPVLVPFMMISQLDFLFWGWFKALLNGVVYMLTAAALYAATAMLLIAPLDRMADAPVPDDAGSFMAVLDLFLRLILEFVPMVVMTLFAALKVNALSSMIVSGGGPPGAGLGSGLTKAVAGSQWLGGPRSRLGGGAVAVPVSQSTDRRRAWNAYQEGRKRTGGGPRPDGGGGGPKGWGGGPGK
jgi:hypothetical protein